MEDAGCSEAGDCSPLAPGELASGQHTPAGIAVDATNVYWVNLGTYAPSDAGLYVGGEIRKCAKSGCNDDPTLLATGPWNGMAKLAVDANSVYWTASGQVLKCAISGCNGSPTVLWSGQGQPADIAVNAAGVYFTNVTEGQVLRCPVDDCSGGASVLWSAADGGLPGQPVGLAMDATSLYLTTDIGAVFSCGASDCGGTFQVLASGQGTLSQIAVDASQVYFTDASGNAGGRIVSWPKDFRADASASSSLLLDGLSVPTAIAVDGANVYFTEEGPTDATGQIAAGAGRVARCTTSGCNDRATAVAGYVNHPLGIAVDATSVYWTDFGSGTDGSGTASGRVMVRPK